MMKHLRLGIFLSAICFCFLSGMVNAAAEDVQSYIEKGEAYSKKGQSDKAIAEFNKALELDPKNARVFNDRGLEFWFKGDIDSALADYNKALEINPSLAMVYN